METSLLLCALLFLAFSANAQCTLSGGKIRKPFLRVRLVMEDGVPNAVQSAFLNGLRSIPDVTVRSDLVGDDDVIIYVSGLSSKLTDGTVIGATWFFRVYRYWRCGPPAMALQQELIPNGLQVGALSQIEATVKDQIAEINVKALEKLRQERDSR